MDNGKWIIIGFILTFSILNSQLSIAQVCAQADLTHPASVSMTWTDNSNDESGFVLERKQDAGPFAVIASAIGANLQSYTDSTVKRSSVPVTYTYRIKAYRASDKTESGYSNESCITFAALLAPLSAPDGLTVSAIARDALRLTWESIPEATSYAVEGKRANRGQYQQVAMTDQVTYDWTGLKRFTSYCTRVSAANPLGISSGPVCATTLR